MTSQALRRWRWLHKWSSIVCTLFLLLLCLTGLPLIFADEINALLDPPRGGPARMEEMMAHVDTSVLQAQHAWPGQSVRLVVFDTEKARAAVYLSRGADDDFGATHQMAFDGHTGVLLRNGAPPGDAVMDTILDLHVNMLAGLPGELFLGVMGVFFAVALLSGVMLYAPFMRRMSFGEIRWEKSRRVRWLDIHNFIGMAAAVWMLVVGLTGVMNTLATPLFGLWESRDVAPLLKPFLRDTPVVPSAPLSGAILTAEAALPGTTTRLVTFPSHVDGSPDHYVVWTQGESKLRSRLMTPVLVDAVNGKLGFVAEMPWYLQVLEICRPLHFGDYGGLAFKGVWAFLDLVTIVVLGSGVYLLLRGKRSVVRAGSTTSMVGREAA